MPRKPKPITTVPAADPLAEFSDLLAQAEHATSKLRRGAGTRRPKQTPEEPAAPSDPIAALGLGEHPADPLPDDDADIARIYAPGTQPEEAEALRQRLRDRIRLEPDEHRSFWLFMSTVKPLIASFYAFGPIHNVIVDCLLSKDPQTILMVSRLSGKSTLCQFYCAWKLLRNPHETILFISRSMNLAKRNQRAVTQLIRNNPVLKELIPNDQCLQAANAMEVPAACGRNLGGPSLGCYGLTSVITGLRCSILIGDDLETSEKNINSMKTQDILERFSECMNLLHPGGIVRVLGTAHFGNLSMYWKLGPEFVMTKAAMVEEQEDPEDRRKIKLISKWPAKWSEADLFRKRRSLTTSAWKTQWLLQFEDDAFARRPLRLSSFLCVTWDPMATTFPTRVLPGGRVAPELNTWGTSERWVRPAEISTELKPWGRTIASIDVSSGLSGRDAIGFCIGSATASGSVVLRHWEGVRGPTTMACIEHIAMLCRKFLVDAIIAEEQANSLFGKILEAELLKRQFPCSVTQVKPCGVSKVTRILQNVEPPLTAGRLILLDAVISAESMAGIAGTLCEISDDSNNFRRQHGIDEVDALSYLCQQFKDTLAADAGDALYCARSEDIDELRYHSMRDGGLVGFEEVLLQEDDNLLQMQTSLDELLSVRAWDLRKGRTDPVLLSRIEDLQNAVNQIKKWNVR